VDQYTKVRGRARRKSKSFKSESEEYDTLGSDSDTEVGTSSRTESSNHLDDSGPTSMMARSPGPNSVNQREQRLALVQRPVHHSKLVFSFLCTGRARSLPRNPGRTPRRQRTASRHVTCLPCSQMCCTTHTNQVHQPSRHQFLRGRPSRGSTSKGEIPTGPTSGRLAPRTVRSLASLLVPVGSPINFLPSSLPSNQIIGFLIGRLIRPTTTETALFMQNLPSKALRALSSELCILRQGEQGINLYA